ncbi:MAG: entericidin A/B family lipoprotein [Litoreibacter sp.]|nr:entericidin A/B family lipoprotein [Litoreibacter sp.]
MIFRVASALVLVFGLSACETMGGMGRDLESGGKALQKAAQ